VSGFILFAVRGPECLYRKNRSYRLPLRSAREWGRPGGINSLMSQVAKAISVADPSVSLHMLTTAHYAFGLRILFLSSCGRKRAYRNLWQHWGASRPCLTGEPPLAGDENVTGVRSAIAALVYAAGCTYQVIGSDLLRSRTITHADVAEVQRRGDAPQCHAPSKEALGPSEDGCVRN
jgi:hypothetical protein